MNEEPNPVNNNVTTDGTNVAAQQPNPVNNIAVPSEPSTPTQQPNPVNSNFIASEPSTPTQQPDFSEEPKSKNNVVLIIIIAVLLIGLGIGGYLFFSQKKLNATEALATSANKQVQKFSQMISDIKSVDVFKEIAATKGSAQIYMELNSTNPMFEQISGLKFDLNAGYDSEKNLFAVYADITDKANNELNLKLDSDGTNLFVNLGNLFPSTIYTPLDMFNVEDLMVTAESSTTSIDEDDIAYLAELVINTVTESIKEEDLVKQDVKKNIYGESLSLTKISYELTKERFDFLYTAVLTKIKGDQKALEILAKNDTEGRSAEEWKTHIDTLIGENVVVEDFKTINLTFYVNSKTELVATEIVNEEETISFIAYKDKYTLNYESKLSVSDKFEIVYDDKEIDTIKFTSAGVNGDIDLTITIDDKSTGDIAKADVNVAVIYGSGEDIINFNIVLNYEINSTYNFVMPTMANAKDMMYLTEEEIDLIEYNLTNNPIGAIFSSFVY